MSPFETFVDSARPNSELWRTLLGAFLILPTWILLSLGSIYALSFFPVHEEFATFVDLFAIALLIPAIWIVVRLIHKRGLISLFGAGGILMRSFFAGMGFGVIYLFVAVMISIPYAPQLEKKELDSIIGF